jgi:hypothetical protein
LGLFKLRNKRLGVFVHFLPQSRAAQAHPLAGTDFYGITRFAQGMFRLSDQAFGLAVGRDAAERERWQFVANQKATLNLFMITPTLDYPYCIWFTSPEDINKLRNKRTVAQLLINSFLCLTAEQTEEPFPQFELFTTVITQSADAIFSTCNAVQVLSKAF